MEPSGVVVRNEQIDQDVPGLRCEKGCGLKRALDDGRVSPGAGAGHHPRVSDCLLSAPIHLKPWTLRQVKIHQPTVYSLEGGK